MTTLSDGISTIEPLLVLGYETARTSRNIMHELLSGDIAVTLRGASLRSGTLEMLFGTEAEAVACAAMHATTGRFTLADADLDSIGMTYVVSGDITRRLEEETRAQWIVTVEYQEVTP